MVAIHEVRLALKSYVEEFRDEAHGLVWLTDMVGDALDVTSREEWRGHVTASAVVVNGSGLVLLVDDAVSGQRRPPGGHVEPGDASLRDAARREVEESTGLDRDALRLARPEPIHVHSHTVPVRYSPPEPEHMHGDFRFLFRTVGDAEVGALQAPEASGADWYTPNLLPPDLLARVLEFGAC